MHKKIIRHFVTRLFHNKNIYNNNNNNYKYLLFLLHIYFNR